MKKNYIVAILLCICFASSCNKLPEQSGETTLPATTFVPDITTSVEETTIAPDTLRFDPYKLDPFQYMAKSKADSVGYDYSAPAPLLHSDFYSEYMGKTLPYKECFELLGLPFSDPRLSRNVMYYFTSDGYMFEISFVEGGVSLWGYLVSVDSRYPEEKFPYYYNN